MEVMPTSPDFPWKEHPSPQVSETITKCLEALVGWKPAPVMLMTTPPASNHMDPIRTQLTKRVLFLPDAVRLKAPALDASTGEIAVTCHEATGCCNHWIRGGILISMMSGPHPRSYIHFLQNLYIPASNRDSKVTPDGTAAKPLPGIHASRRTLLF